MNKNFKNMSIGAIASVIAGAYYLYGSRDGEAKRKQIAAWSLKLKGEVLQGIERLKDVSEPAYRKVVKEVSERYKKIDKGELKKVVDELNSTWNKMKKEVATEIAKREAQIAKESKSDTRSVTKVKKPVANKKAQPSKKISSKTKRKSRAAKATEPRPVEIPEVNPETTTETPTANK